MGERHGFESRCSDEAVDSKFCWGTWLEEVFEDNAFIRQLELAAAQKLGGDADVDEVLQEVWVKLLERNRQLEGGKGPRAYVMSTVLGTALQFRKRRNEAREQVTLCSNDIERLDRAHELAGESYDQNTGRFETLAECRYGDDHPACDCGYCRRRRAA